MERTVSIEERIRKAEEIYYKRKNPGAKIETERISTSTINTNSFAKRKMKKLFIQISISIILYVIVYSTDFGTTIFKEDTANYIKNFLAVDIDFQSLYKNVNEYLQSIMPKDENDELNNVNSIDSVNEGQNNILNEVNVESQNAVSDKVNTESQEAATSNENTEIQGEADETTEVHGEADETVEIQEGESTESGTSNTEIVDSEENIGGAVEVEQSSDETGNEQKTEAELNAEYILSKVSFIKPLENYQITSRYGLRNPTTSTVPKNHTGIDLAAEKGTKIVSATDGTVILASSQGDYGNHLKIQAHDVIIVYAHCEKLYVEEGQQISQGQEIAEVGSSGNSTGPHLHFEVRLNEKVIDPEYILDFS